MKKILFILLSGIAFDNMLFSQSIPGGYIMQYQQDFSQKKAIEDFRFSISESSKIGMDQGKSFLEMSNVIDIQTPSSQPVSICMLDKFIFGDFIL